MLKNVKVKKILKNTVFKCATALNKVVPKDESIVLLYSGNRGIWNNLKALKDYLLDNNYDKKYRIVCGIESMQYAEEDSDRVEYMTKIRSFLLFLRAYRVFYTAGQIPIKPARNQMVIHMDHGTAAIKTGGALSKINNGDEFFFTHYLVPSPIYIPIAVAEYLCKEENVLVCGETSTDVMFHKYNTYDLGDFKKIIFWAPTFRQSDYFGYDDSSEELLPLFVESEYEQLNDVLKKYNFKLIVKLHPGQDLRGYSKLFYSNLYIYSDLEFKKTGMDIYHLMPQVDFLLADYSSVYLQYLLLDKPMAFVVPDMEEYAQKRGFIFENPLDFMPGQIIKTKEQFWKCLEDVNNEVDYYSQKRKEVRDKVYTYQDGKNCERVIKIAKM